MKPKHFTTNRRLWLLFSVLVFAMCWLYPSFGDKSGSRVSIFIKMWIDIICGRGETGLWVMLLNLTMIFGMFAALVGFAMQALVVVLQNRKQ